MDTGTTVRLPPQPPAQPVVATPAKHPCNPHTPPPQAYILTSSALVLLMIPALALFYGGFVGERMAISTM